MKKAERNCRKLQTGETPWSLAYQKGSDKVDAVSTLLQRRGGAKIGPHLCKWKLNKAGILHLFTASADIIKEQRKGAYRELKQLKKKASILQENWLDSLTEARAEQGNTTQEKQLIELKRRGSEMLELFDGAMSDFDQAVSLWL
jgi:hypothetical protein